MNDACGMAGGTVPGQAGPGDAVFYDNQFAKMGDLGSHVLPRAPSSTVWTAGSTVTVSWGIRFSTFFLSPVRTAAVPAPSCQDLSIYLSIYVSILSKKIS